MNPRVAVVRFLLLFVVVAALFLVVEILPLHFGSRHLPWSELMPAIRERALRMTLVAVAVAGFLTWKSGKSERSSTPDR